MAIGALIAFAFWLFVALPLYYGPRDDPAAHKCSAKENENYSFWEKTRCDPVAYFTAWLVGFTGVLGFSTIGLWWVTWQGSKRQARDMEASVAAAHRSADIAEKALLSVEIPYLYPFVRRHGIKRQWSAKTEAPEVAGFEFGNNLIDYYFRNFGRTPAEIIEVFSVIQFSMGIPPAVVPPEQPFNRLSGLVVTDEIESEDFPCALTEGMYKTLYRGEFNPVMQIVWLMGYVRFNDVFGNEYVRGFCLAFAPNVDKFYPMGGDGYNYRKKTKSAGETIPKAGQPLTN
jgi:hypothetical protein